MPPIRPPTPDYGLSELGPLDTGGPAHPDAMMQRYRQMEQEGRLFNPATGQPTIPLQPEYYQQRGAETLARGAAGFVPVAGTAANWNQMAPWERGLSMGLDAVDLATLGGGKALTTPARWGTKAALGLARRGDPSYVHLRHGLPAFAGVPKSGRFMGYQPDPWVEEAFARGKGGQFKLDTSFNYATGQREPGISAYGALRYKRGLPKNILPYEQGDEFFEPMSEMLPDTPQWVMRPPPDVNVTRPLPKDAPFKSRPGQAGATSYTVNPYLSQQGHLGKFMQGKLPGSLYEMTGLKVSGRRGGDLEELIDAPSRIKRAVGVDPSDIYISPPIQKQAAAEFAKYDRFGNRILTPFERSMEGARLGSSLPWTSSFRAVSQTAPNLEEEYQRTHRPKSAARGGPRAPGEGLFNPISPSI
jgi:hypothetical protein